MQEQVGLSESSIVLLQMGPIIGGFTAVFLFGWAADRYGSKPVMQLGLAVKVLLPIAWLLLPRHSDLSLALAMAIAFVWGIAEIGWAIGSGRLLFVSVVPFEKRAEYMAVYYTLIGTLGGISQIISGRLLDLFSGISGQFLFFEADRFTPLLIGGLVLTAVGFVLFRRVKADSSVSMGEFAGMFVHGNPLMAFGSLLGYYRARDERATVVSTERMGKTKSPLTVDELLEALTDPRFNVRFEAIISIARMGAEPRLVKALTGILDGTELSLSVIAAWALGRMGDPEALPTLREGLNSNYRSIQAHCIRSLGTLHDYESAPLLLERLKNEKDKGLRIAYASALGNLHDEDAVETIFVVLDEMENEGARMELALSLARILAGDHHFIRLLRGLRHDPGTTTWQVLNGWRRKVGKGFDAELKALIDACAHLFASGDIDGGARRLSEIIGKLPPGEENAVSTKLLAECARKLGESGAERFEYLLLALYTLEMQREA